MKDNNNNLKVFVRNQEKQISYSLSILQKVKHLNPYPFFSNLISIVTNINEFFRISNLKNSKKNKDCLVLGNGPSASSLDIKDIIKFKKDGGQIIVVNYFFYQKIFNEVTPDWLIVRDPKTFDTTHKRIGKKARGLLEYLKINSNIKILSSIKYKKELLKLFPSHLLYFYSHEHIRFGNMTSLIFPKSFSKFSVFISLSFAQYLGFKKIGIVGIDLNYFKNISVDESNRLILREQHSYEDDYLIDITEQYCGIKNFLFEITKIFYDLEMFDKERIFNLDKKSLIDQFSKIDLKKFTNIS